MMRTLIGAVLVLALAACGSTAEPAAPVTITQTVTDSTTLSETSTATKTVTVSAEPEPADTSQLVACQMSVGGLLAAVSSLGQAIQATQDILEAGDLTTGLDKRSARDAAIQSALDAKTAVDSQIDACLAK